MSWPTRTEGTSMSGDSLWFCRTNQVNRLVFVANRRGQRMLGYPPASCSKWPLHDHLPSTNSFQI